jgi:hypothetical protein
MAARANSGVQRMSLRSTADAESLGGLSALAALSGVVLGLGAFLGCKSAPPVPRDQMLVLAESCRGWITQPGPPSTVRRVAGVTFFRDNQEPLPNVYVVLSDESRQVRFAVHSNKNGHFDFGRIPDGRYVLKTCLDGFTTTEFTVTVSKHSSSDRLYIGMALSS